MIDLHSHLLPGIDDGADSWEETLEMARAALDDGVTCMVATPHMMPDGEFANRSHGVLALIEETKERLARESLPLEVVAGGELYIHPTLHEGVRDGTLLTYGKAHKYALVELPSIDVPPYAERVIFELQVGGVQPILAHPERNPSLVQGMERLVEWVERGLLLQVNARSLLGDSGSRSRRFAEELLEWRLVHFIASDAHGIKRRPPGLSAARERAAGIVGPQMAEAMVRTNPARVIAGEPVHVWPIERPKRQRMLRRLWGRSRARAHFHH